MALQVFEKGQLFPGHMLNLKGNLISPLLSALNQFHHIRGINTSYSFGRISVRQIDLQTVSFSS